MVLRLNTIVYWMILTIVLEIPRQYLWLIKFIICLHCKVFINWVIWIWVSLFIFVNSSLKYLSFRINRNHLNLVTNCNEETGLENSIKQTAIIDLFQMLPSKPGAFIFKHRIMVDHRQYLFFHFFCVHEHEQVWQVAWLVWDIPESRLYNVFHLEICMLVHLSDLTITSNFT